MRVCKCEDVCVKCDDMCGCASMWVIYLHDRVRGKNLSLYIAVM